IGAPSLQVPAFGKRDDADSRLENAVIDRIEIHPFDTLVVDDFFLAEGHDDEAGARVLDHLDVPSKTRPLATCGILGQIIAVWKEPVVHPGVKLAVGMRELYEAKMDSQ